MTARAFDLRRTRIVLRERSVAEVLDLALRFVVVNARTYAAVAAVALVPAALACAVAGDRLGWRSGWALAAVLALAADVPFTLLASRLVFDDRVRARDVLRDALPSAGRVVALRLAALPLVAILLLALVVPGVWLATTLLFATEVALLEQAGLGRVFGRAARLASSAPSGAVLGLGALLLLAVAGVLFVDVAGRALIGEILLFQPPRPVWSTGGGVLPVLGLFLAIPYLATARLLLYLNVRTRTEGWDIQVRFAALAARDGTEER